MYIWGRLFQNKKCCTLFCGFYMKRDEQIFWKEYNNQGTEISSKSALVCMKKLFSLPFLVQVPLYTEWMMMNGTSGINFCVRFYNWTHKRSKNCPRNTNFCNGIKKIILIKLLCVTQLALFLLKAAFVLTEALLMSTVTATYVFWRIGKKNILFNYHQILGFIMR